VIVNPLSLVAPGIFREMFQMTASDPRVQVRGDEQAPSISARTPAQPRSKANFKSKSKKTKAKSKKSGRAQADAIDGWSSTTTSRGN
jgi:hypothetical protein